MSGTGSVADGGTIQPWPLSSAENALWAQHLHNPDDSSYLLPVVLEVTGPQASASARVAVPTLLERHPVLRSCPNWDVPARWEERPTPPGSMPKAEGPEQGIDNFLVGVRQDARTPFKDLSVETPCRFGVAELDADRCLVWLIVHHIAADLHAAGTLLGEFAALMLGFPLPSPLGPGVLVGAESDYRKSPSYNEDLAYWRDEAPRLPELPEARGTGIAVCARQLSPEQAQAITATAKRLDRSMGSLVQAAYCLGLHSLEQRRSVSLGVTYDLRRASGAWGAVGYGVNTVPVRSELGAASVGEYLDDFTSRSRQARLHHRLPTAEIAAARSREAQGRLFDDLLVFTHDTSGQTQQRWILAPEESELQTGPYSMRRIPVSRGAVQCRSILTVCADSAGIGLWLEYQPDRVPDAERLLDEIVANLQALLVDPTSPMPLMKGERA